MKKKIAFKKLVISKLNNPSNIVGGAAFDLISTRPLGCPISISAIKNCTNK